MTVSSPYLEHSDPPHALPVDEVARAYGVDLDRGLSASDAALRLREFGPNRLAEPTGLPYLRFAVRQPLDPLVAQIARKRWLQSANYCANIISTMLWTIDHTAPTTLRDQIAGCVRRGLASGELCIGTQLPPAAELAEALAVDRNTVLAAYRQLRDRGVLEFRRGRGVRVARGAASEPAVVDAATALIDVGRQHGLDRNDLIQLIQELT